MVEDAINAAVTAITGGTLPCFIFIVIGVPYWPTLILSEVTFAALFSLSWWKPDWWHDVARLIRERLRR